MLRVAAAVVLAGGSAALAASVPVQPRAVPIDLQLSQARREAASAEAEQRRLEAAANKARDEALRLRAHQLAAAQAIAAAEARISAADVHARIVHAYLAAQRSRLAAEQAPMRSLLAGLVLTARRPPVLLLADSGSAEDLVKLRLLIRATTPVIEARTSAIAKEIEQARRLEQAAAEARRAMARTREELARKREAFAELEARATHLAETRGSQALGAGDVALARQEQAGELQREVVSARSAAQLARELARLGPAPIPVPGDHPGIGAPFDYRLPADAPLSEGLGEVSPNGVRSRGVTLATRHGTPLQVPGDGTILFAGPFRDYDGVVIIDHGSGWKSVLVNAGSSLRKGARARAGDALGIALGPVEVQLQHEGRAVSPALIAGSSAVLSNKQKGG